MILLDQTLSFVCYGVLSIVIWNVPIDSWLSVNVVSFVKSFGKKLLWEPAFVQLVDKGHDICTCTSIAISIVFNGKNQPNFWHDLVESFLEWSKLICVEVGVKGHRLGHFW